VEAAEALALGLVNQVVDDDQLLPAAIALADELADRSPEALRLTKQVLHRNVDASFPTWRPIPAFN
jgi:enoyl-CoA hydratase/carnithine racemase